MPPRPSTGTVSTLSVGRVPIACSWPSLVVSAGPLRVSTSRAGSTGCVLPVTAAGSAITSWPDTVVAATNSAATPTASTARVCLRIVTAETSPGSARLPAVHGWCRRTYISQRDSGGTLRESPTNSPALRVSQRSGVEAHPGPQRTELRWFAMNRKLRAGGAVVVIGVGIGTEVVIAKQVADSDTPITGPALDQATQVALAYTGQGHVTGTEVGDEESYYQVEVTLNDGSQM